MAMISVRARGAPAAPAGRAPAPDTRSTHGSIFLGARGVWKIDTKMMIANTCLMT